MVAAAPATIAKNAMNEPRASVDTPVIPWPMVQPIASTPPKPMSAPPTTWAMRSFASRKLSRRNVRVARA